MKQNFENQLVFWIKSFIATPLLSVHSVLDKLDEPKEVTLWQVWINGTGNMKAPHMKQDFEIQIVFDIGLNTVSLTKHFGVFHNWYE